MPETLEISRETLDAFDAVLEGSLVYPDDEGFAEAVALWNGMIKKRPGLVVQPLSTQDVVATVNFARDHDIELSIKGGGHNIAGLAPRPASPASRSAAGSAI